MYKFSNHGQPHKDVYERLPSDTGLRVEVVGKEDLQSYIQSFADSCNIESLVARAVYDPAVLNQRNGMYADVTQMPATYADMLQKVIDARSVFDSLSEDVRNRYSNDVFKWIADMDNPDWVYTSGFARKEETDLDQKPGVEVRTEPDVT